MKILAADPSPRALPWRAAVTMLVAGSVNTLGKSPKVVMDFAASLLLAAQTTGLTRTAGVMAQFERLPASPPAACSAANKEHAVNRTGRTVLYNHAMYDAVMRCRVQHPRGLDPRV